MALNYISNFQSRFREALDGAPFNASVLAEKIGLSRQAISAYLTGVREPKRPTLKAIAEQLNVNEAWLMGYDVPAKRVSPVSKEPDPYKSQLDECYNMLNNYGKREACRRISELTEIPRYTVNSEEKEVQQTNSITFMDEDTEQELSDEERQKQLAQFLKDRREGKTRFTSYAAYGGNGVEGKATTKEDSDTLADAVKKIKAARQHKNTGEDES